MWKHLTSSSFARFAPMYSSYAEPIARLLRKVRHRPDSRVPVGAWVTTSYDELIGRLVAEITRGELWVAVGRVPRTRSRRAHDEAMVEQYDHHRTDVRSARSTPADRRTHYLRHGSQYVVVADHPFTEPTGVVAADVSEYPVRVGDYWITAVRREGRWTGLARMDGWPE